MSFTNGSQSKVSRSGSSRKRLVSRRTKLQSRRLFLENLEDRRMLYGGVTSTVNFDLDSLGAKPNGFTSVDSSLVHFTDSNGTNLSVLTLGGGQTIGRSLRVQTNTDDSSLIMNFDEPICKLSLAFGNDDAGFSNAGDRAVLTVFNNAVQVGQVTVQMNRNDIMDQTISFEGSEFNRAEFKYDVNPATGLSEIVDNITFTTQGPVSLLGLPAWTELGSKPMLNSGFTNDPGNPASGGVEDVAIDPNNPAHILVATVNGGIWRTTNGNAPYDGIDNNGFGGVDDALEQPDWFPLTDDFPTLAMGGIAFSPLDATGNTVFAGSGSASSLSNAGGVPIGVFRTTDGGNSWSVFPLTPGPGEPQVRAVLPTVFDADPGTAGVQQVVLVATVSGLFRSTDAGQTYTLISGTNGLSAGAVTQVIVDPNNSSRYFAGVVGSGVFLSTDGGLNWAPVNTGLAGLAGSTLVELAAHPGGGTTVLYAHISGPAPATFISNNGGALWTGLAALPGGFTSGFNGLYTDMAADQLTVDPTNSQIVYLAKGYGGSPYVLRYNPAGAGSWVTIDTASGGTRPHVDSRDLLFSGNNTLLYANDGGLYFLNNPQNAAANRWTSLHGRGENGLGPKEFTNIAWDSNFDVVTGGAQDNGTSVQNGQGDPVWTLYNGADGGDVQVDAVNAGAGRSFRYASVQNHSFFAGTRSLGRFTFDSATNQPIASVELMPAGGLTGFSAYFTPPYQLNDVNLARLVIGGAGASPVYELTNAATAPNAAGATWVAVPVGAGFGSVNSGFGAPIANGGRLGGVDNPEVLVVGSGSRVFVRSTAGGTLTATPTAFPGGTVVDVILDPENWRHFFVTDGTGVWETPDAGLTTWNNVTANLALVNNRLQSLEFVPTPTGGVLLAGGNLGVSRLLDGVWTRFGLNLPNALVADLDYNATDDVLIAGEFGRGAWLIPQASVAVSEVGVLNVCGDDSFPNQDDTFRIVRNSSNPLILEIYVNGVLGFTGPLAAVQQINVFAGGGNDRLIVDSSNGLISVANGIRYDGDHGCPDDAFAGIGGFDRLDLVQTGGSATGVTDVVAVGATNGSGRSTITSGANIQRVDFQYLEPIVNTVPAASFSITSIPGLASLLQGDNAINYSAASLIPPPAATIGGRVTVDAFEPIEFANKTTLIIDAGSGSDTINLNNATTPTGLASITVSGGDPTGSDTVIANGTGAADAILVTPTAANAGTVTGAGPVPITISTAEHLTVNGLGGNDTLTVQGTTASDITTYTPGSTVDGGLVQVNSLLPLTFANIGAGGTLSFTDQGGAFNKLVYNGTDTNDNFGVNVVGAGIISFQESVNSLLGGTDHVRVTVPTVGNLIQALTLNTFDGEDSFVINSSTLFTGGIAANGGNPSSGSDRVTLNGSAAADAIDLQNDRVTGIVAGSVVLTGIEHLTLNGAAGNDAYTVNIGPSELQDVSMFAGGDAGDSLTVNGTAVDDTFHFVPQSVGTGSLVVTSVGANSPVSPKFSYNGFAGTLTVFGSAGFNTLEVTATAGNDVINAIQPDATHLNLTLNAFTQIFTTSFMQRASLLAGNGDDLIRVSVADSLAGSLGFDVDGGSPNASDRLIVDDAGLGDLTILRQAPDQRSGSVTVGALNPVFYTDIERLDITPVNSVTGGVGTDGAGRIKVFHSDPFEYNETRLTAATLSRVGESANRPTIDPGAVVAPFSVPGDEDWYDFRPQATGTFAVKILFDLQPALANGRAGLPGAGDLNLDIYDANGVLITSGAVTGGGKIATFGATNDPAFPQFNRIFVRVRGATPESLNHYEFDNLDGVGTGNPGVINVDVFGPQVTDVQVNNVPTATYNLFGQKPTNAVFHPTPLTTSLTMSFRDPPPRAPGFLYPALEPVTALAPGTYVVKGDATGIAAISSIILVNNPVVVGGIPTATVQIVFAKPLPDDRFTLTINDNLEDPAGNALDGESNAAEPNGAPTFPSGDSHAGGDFIARFTIDSRAELGAFSAGSVYVDTNGNYSFDPTNTDSTNRDITYLMGFTSDNIFAGNFVKTGSADGFDKLAAYGKVGSNYRWLIDVNNDGIIVPGTDINVNQPLFAGVTNLSGMPAAGNFDGSPPSGPLANGDEVALKVGNTWLLDKVGHDFVLDTKLPGTNMVGLPIVGDFDGDGIDDLGSWADDKFYLNLSTLGAIDGTADKTFTFGFASVRERPVAGDFDGDGISDLGLWVPDRSGVAPTEAAEWYLLISGGVNIVSRLAAGNGVINFTPTPFGNDLFAQFGDEFGLPVPGNFDPPITSAPTIPGYTNTRDKLDVNNDGTVAANDALLIINRLSSGNTSLANTPFTHAPFVDVNGDGTVSAIDALLIINRLNSTSVDSGTSGEGEADAADSVFAELGDVSSNDDSISALLATDDYLTNRKR